MRSDGASRGRAGALAAGAIALASLTSACDRGPDPISDEGLGNATYHVAGVEAETVTLTDGEYLLMEDDGAGPRLHVRLVSHAAGDLDHDGGEDAAAMLAQNTGDRTILFYLHALVRDGRQATDVASRLVGDRIFVRGLRIDDGMIEADLTVRRPGEPGAVEPSVPVTLRYVLTDRGLMQVGYPAELVEPAPALPDDARGTLARFEWELAAIRTSDGELTPPAPAQGEVAPSLSFREELRGSDESSGSLHGSTGCNLLFGDYRATAGGSLSVRSLATTQRECTRDRRELERRFLSALPAAGSFSLSGDELEVSFGEGTLRFRRGAERSPGPETATAEAGREAGPGASPEAEPATRSSGES